MKSAPGYSVLIGGLAVGVSLLLWRFPGMAFTGFGLGCVGLAVAIMALITTRRSGRIQRGAALIGLALSVSALLWFPVTQFSSMRDRAYGELDLQTRPAEPIDAIQDEASGHPPPVSAPPPTPESTGTLRRTVDGAAPLRQDQSLTQRLGSDISALGREAPELNLAEFEGRVDTLRESIVEMESSGEADSLHRRLDTIVLKTLDHKAAPLVEEAQRRYESGDVSGAIEASAEAFALYETHQLWRAPATMPLPLDRAQRIYGAARHYQTMIEDPTARFRLRGIVGGRDDPVVQIDDLLTGERHRLQQGDLLDDFIIETVDPTARTVTLRHGSRTFTLERR